jgi:hypothetical protein
LAWGGAQADGSGHPKKRAAHSRQAGLGVPLGSRPGPDTDRRFLAAGTCKKRGILGSGRSQHVAPQKKGPCTAPHAHRSPPGPAPCLQPLPCPPRGAWAVLRASHGLRAGGACVAQPSIVGSAPKDCGNCGDLEKGRGRPAPLPTPARSATFADLLRARVGRQARRNAPGLDRSTRARGRATLIPNESGGC